MRCLADAAVQPSAELGGEGGGNFGRETPPPLPGLLAFSLALPDSPPRSLIYSERVLLFRELGVFLGKGGGALPESIVTFSSRVSTDELGLAEHVPQSLPFLEPVRLTVLGQTCPTTQLFEGKRKHHLALLEIQ